MCRVKYSRFVHTTLQSTEMCRFSVFSDRPLVAPPNLSDESSPNRPLRTKTLFSDESFHPPALHNRQKTPAKRTKHRTNRQILGPMCPFRLYLINIDYVRHIEFIAYEAANMWWGFRVCASVYRSVCVRKNANCPSLFISFINILFPFFILASFACASKTRYSITHAIR